MSWKLTNFSGVPPLGEGRCRARRDWGEKSPSLESSMDVNSWIPFHKIICISEPLLKEFQASLQRWGGGIWACLVETSTPSWECNPAWVDKGPFSDSQNGGCRDRCQPGRAWEGGEISASYLSLELKVNTLDSPAVSRYLESIDFLLCELNSPLLSAHIRPISNPSKHMMEKPASNKPCVRRFWNSGLVLCSIPPPPQPSAPSPTTPCFRMTVDPAWQAQGKDATL